MLTNLAFSSFLDEMSLTRYTQVSLYMFLVPVRMLIVKSLGGIRIKTLQHNLKLFQRSCLVSILLSEFWELRTGTVPLLCDCASISRYLMGLKIDDW